MAETGVVSLGGRGLTRTEQRRWQRLERRADRQFDAEQLSALKGLTGSLVSAESARAAGDLAAGPVVLGIGGRRVALTRVHAGAWEALRQSTENGRPTFEGVGRYGPYWVLRFGGDARGAPAVLLAERLRLLPSGYSAVDPSSSPAAAEHQLAS